MTLAAPGRAGALGPPDVVLAGRFEPSDLRRYRHVPFDVPAGLHQLHLRYAYTDRIDSDPTLTGGNTVDIGLFDERGTADGGEGFRGWSGSNKLELTVDERWATPPYRAGPIGGGTWHVLLGPYKVAPSGCAWRVEIWFDPAVPQAPADAPLDQGPAAEPLPPGRPGWLRGDLHCHTRYSDGDSWPPEMLRRAGEAGLEFLGVTDHNNVAHHEAYGAGGDGAPCVLPGVEVTTYGGHWNAWGTDRWWEFREPTSESVGRAMHEAAASGAVVSVNHPKPLGPDWEYAVSGFHAVEVWNGPWIRLNQAALSWWEELLRRGTRVAAVGGSDTHYLRRQDPDPRHSPAPGAPTTWLRAGNGDPGVLLEALREGLAFVSASPRGPQLYLDAAGGGRVSAEVRDGRGAALLLLDQTGVVAAAPLPAGGWDGLFDVPKRAAYVRAQLVAPGGELLALTNPLWAERL